MGQGSQSGMEGQHPAWSQMARMGGVTAPLEMLQAQDAFRDQRDEFRSLDRQGRQEAAPDFLAAKDQFTAMRNGPQLPDPMQQAREHVMAARDQFLPLKQKFHRLQNPNKRDALRPELLEARGEFQQMRDWYGDLQGMPDDTAIGTAALGPPRPWEGPQFAPMMEVPQFPGMPQHDGTVDGLLGILQQQTANQTFGSNRDRSGRIGGGGMVRTPDGNMAPEGWRDRYKRLPDWESRGTGGGGR